MQKYDNLGMLLYFLNLLWWRDLVVRWKKSTKHTIVTTSLNDSQIDLFQKSLWRSGVQLALSNFLLIVVISITCNNKMHHNSIAIYFIWLYYFYLKLHVYLYFYVGVDFEFTYYVYLYVKCYRFFYVDCYVYVYCYCYLYFHFYVCV